jgi:hypothetical protein
LVDELGACGGAWGPGGVMAAPDCDPKAAKTVELPRRT